MKRHYRLRTLAGDPVAKDVVGKEAALHMALLKAKTLNRRINVYPLGEDGQPQGKRFATAEPDGAMEVIFRGSDHE